MNYISLITIIVFGLYCVYCGVLPSISDSYRHVNKALYHGFFFVLSGLVWMQNIYAPEKFHIPYTLAGFFLFCVSLAAAFWKPEEKWLHAISTYLAIGIGQTLTILRIWPQYGFIAIVPAAILLVSAVIMHDMKNGTFWIEILAVLTIFAPLL